MPPIVVYTDGACLGNGARGAPGGWACVFEDGRTLSGGEADTTNQRMELLAAIHALEHTPPGAAVEVVSDSAYLVRAFTEGWHARWEERGWKNSQGKPVANRDLWERLLALSRSRRVRFRQVAGHAGDARNDLADRLAREAAERARG